MSKVDLVKNNNQALSTLKEQRMLDEGAPDVDISKSVRRGVILLLLLLVILIAWAAFAPLDEGVPIDGKITVENRNKVIQHLYGGIVEQLHVHEGQVVKAGDVLMTLDAASTRARFEEIRQHYLGLRSNENRLLSEKQGTANIRFHNDLLAAAADESIRTKMQDQSQLMAAHKNLLAADLNQINQSIAAEQASIVAEEQLVVSKLAELSLLQKQMADIKEAVEEGFVTKQQAVELEQRAVHLQGELASLNGAINKSKQQIAELRSKYVSRVQRERKEIEESLAQVRMQVDAEQEKFKALQLDLARTEIKAPLDGQVLALQVHSAGAVVQPGQKLMYIVPTHANLLLDAKIPAHLIDRVEIGQPADIRFSSFAHSPQLLAEGLVKAVSNDSMSDSNSRAMTDHHYYLAQIEVTDAGMKVLGSRQLKPGMPVQVVIKTGERTLLNYLLHPLTKRLGASLTEE